MLFNNSSVSTALLWLLMSFALPHFFVCGMFILLVVCVCFRWLCVSIFFLTRPVIVESTLSVLFFLDVHLYHVYFNSDVTGPWTNVMCVSCMCVRRVVPVLPLTSASDRWSFNSKQSGAAFCGNGGGCPFFLD